MVEAGANEIPEAEILDALDIAHDGDQEALRARSASCAEKAGKEKIEVEAAEVDEALLEQIKASHGARARRGDPGRGQARAPGRDARPSRPRSLEQYAG